MILRTATIAAIALCLGAFPGCAPSSSPGSSEDPRSRGAALSAGDAASLAQANVGKMACDDNSLGGQGFESSCYGNNGQPEYWCADFVKWCWENAGLNVDQLDAGAVSFWKYGAANQTLHTKDNDPGYVPQVGDAVVFAYSPTGGWDGGPTAAHVAIVTSVSPDGNTIGTISGDWNGQMGTEAYFSSTSHAIDNGTYYDGYGWCSAIGYSLDGFVSPIGGGAAPPPPPPPPPSSSCGVQGDGLLHCDDQAHSAMYAQSTFSSGVVDYLESTNSWFQCWGTGDLHPGGNTTWYYTQGDDNGSWGWVPAVDLSTDSAFDANPTAFGLPACN
jgi:hypothetical protein